MAIKFKDVYPWVITVSALLGIWQFVVPKAKNLLDFRNNVSFEATRVYGFNFVGGLFGNFVFNTDISVTNPTNADVLLKKPYIKAYINGNYIGDTTPTAETTKILPNAATEIKNIQVKIPLANVGNLVPVFTALTKGQTTGNQMTLEIRTEVNGLPVEKQIEYQI